MFERALSTVWMHPCPTPSFLRDAAAGNMDNLMVDLNTSTEVTDVTAVGLRGLARLPDGREITLPRSAWRRALIRNKCSTQDDDGERICHWNLCVLRGLS